MTTPPRTQDVVTLDVQGAAEKWRCDTYGCRLPQSHGVAVLDLIRHAIRSVRNPHFFTNELGYQGELLAEIRSRLPEAGLPGDAVVQEEYQKRLADHGINVRPDIIIHVPTRPGGDRRDGNFAVFELNRGAGPAEVQEDFNNLDTVMQVLQYPLAVFLNVVSGRTQAARYRGLFRACNKTLTCANAAVRHRFEWRDSTCSRPILRT